MYGKLRAVLEQRDNKVEKNAGAFINDSCNAVDISSVFVCFSF